MSVSNLLKLVLHWTGYGEEGTLSWHFTGNAATHSPSQLQAAAGNALSNWSTSRTPSSKTGFLGMLTPSQSVDAVTLYEYSTAPGPATALGRFAVSGWAGTASSMAAPLQTSLVASLKTALAGASYRGRQYFPAVNAAPAMGTALTLSTVPDAYCLLAANMGPEAAAGIASSLSISTLTWGVYSPTKGVCTPINSVTVDNKLDTQRRREAQLKPSYSKTLSV